MTDPTPTTPPIKRFAVTGGRDFTNRPLIEAALKHIPPRDAVMVHGAARGADNIAAHTWVTMGGTCEPHPANWDKYGQAAGHIRNQEMVDSGLDLLIAFPGGNGTANMVERAKKAGVRVLDMHQTSDAITIDLGSLYPKTQP